MMLVLPTLFIRMEQKEIICHYKSVVMLSAISLAIRGI